ncbi:MAG: hypothetical protein K6A30_01525 [Lachnospiraceae bacterium]|nr:hypothetical protein [Lachnospiraceae bacterium]
MGIFDALFGRRNKRKLPTYDEIFENEMIKDADASEDEKEKEKEEENIRMNQELEEIKETLKQDVEQILSKSDEISELIEGTREDIGKRSASIEEKIHSENVKTYRNIQAVLDEMMTNMAKAKEQEKQMESLKNYLRCSMWFSVITLLVLIGFILYSMGVF